MDAASDSRTSLSSGTVHEHAANVTMVAKATEKSDIDQFEVKYEENDPANPQNWSRWFRWYITMSAALLACNATFASSAPSGVLQKMSEHFHMSREVATLSLSIFVAGYCVGPILWGPLSEQFGRRPINIGAFFIYTVFQIACAVANNTTALVIFRFIGGVFAAAPLTNSGGIIADIWDAKTRGKAMAFFTLAPFAGPTLSPTISGFIGVSGLSWAWVFWVLTCFAGACWLQIIFTIPETYTPVILAKKAARLRKETGDSRYWAPLDKTHVGFVERSKRTLLQPFKMLFFEPMLLAITLYMGFIYGCVYLLFEAYPIVFTVGHRLNAGKTGLAFLAIFIGGAICVATSILIFNKRYERAIETYAPNPVPPEVRLQLGAISAPVIVIAFFWFGWTSYPTISLWAPLSAGVFMGFGICCVFLSFFNYIIDAYLYAAASALAANTIVRSLFGFGFPLFATQMYEKLNPRWASTLLGLLALVMMPIPFVLIRYGPYLRQKSRFAPKKLSPLPATDKPTSAV